MRDILIYMALQSGIVFIFGALIGTLLMMGVFLMSRRRRAHRHHNDPLYAAARFAAATHLKRYGNLTHAVLKDALDVPDMTVERYLSMLERDGLLSRHGHGVKSFYTRA